MAIDPSRGFVAIPRGLTDWEWYTEPNTARLFIHLLLTANWQEKQWQGITIHPGELVTSQSQLAKQLNLSVQEVRTALKHLTLTGWLTVKTGPKYSVVTINNYGAVTDSNRVSNRQLTGNQQAANNNLTIKTIKTRQSSAAETPPDDPTTTALRMEFESSIGKLSPNGKKELAGYADRLGAELVGVIIHKCADAGGRSWAYVCKALAEAESQGCKSADEYQRTHPIGAGRNLRVIREIPPDEGNWMQNRSFERTLRRMKKKGEGT